MKNMSVIALAATLALFSFNTIPPSTWKLDAAHSKLGFSITHLSVSEVEGSFKKVDATIVATKDDFSDAKVTMTADVNSIDTDNEDRDAHLKKPDFFDAEKYPTITFESTSFKKTGEKTYKVKGNLTLHGVTKPVELDAKVNIGTNPMSKKTIAGFKITGTIKRTDFGISKDTPSVMLSDEVAIEANIEFAKD
ncbi:YceI family protein [Chryseosolibacter indicus]|uniref:YceI family protein n=1 Tax=Chryseosolibacter indicus TaxID=2782351 RepID=A0ABS5VN40_9BACT|nr:YceI family protein [Chryseosolibacter indicus]MBT1702187.1 YceI family protein [Chryseosolibacter indicus]